MKVRTSLAAIATTALLAGGASAASAAPYVIAKDASAKSTAKKYAKKYAKSYAKKYAKKGAAGPAGPAGPAGAAGAPGNGTKILFKAQLGSGVGQIFTGNSLTLTDDCSTTGSVTASTSTDNAVLYAEDIDAGANPVAFNFPDFDTGAQNTVSLGTGNFGGTLSYVNPSGGTVNIVFANLLGSNVANCLFTGTASVA